MTESFRGSETITVEMGSPRITVRQDDVRLERRTRTGPAEGYPAGLGAKAHHLRVTPRARREPLGADMESLEEIRLTCSVRAVQKHNTRLEPKLQTGVRAEVPERDLADDQPASRIGMIRYQKLSSGDVMSPGRKRLMSLS